MNSPIRKHDSSEDVILNSHCTGCGACINICPYRKLNKNGAVIVFNCSHTQGKCDNVCPMTNSQNYFSARDKTSPIGNILEIYRSKAGKKFKNFFTAKKTVTALNCFILNSSASKKILMTKTGKNLRPIPFFAGTEEEIINLSQTNYCSSPLLSSVNLSEENSYSFTGLPCHILSLAKFEKLDSCFQKPFLPEIKISLFCTWSLDPEGYARYLSKNFKDKKIKASYMIPGSQKKIFFEFDDGSKTEKNLDEIKPFVRKGCSICTDLTGEYSDISVGDCETDQNFNTLIIRTEKGSDLVRNAVKSSYLEIYDYPEKTRIMLENASISKKEKI